VAFQPQNGAIRIVVEPKPGRPTDPRNVDAAIDTFTSDALVAVGIPRNKIRVERFGPTS
jgi:hypothetical protein